MKTEIFGTFGPSCNTQDTLEKMIEAGLTGMRLNLSHTTLQNGVDYIKAYQDAAKKAGVVPQILIDMQGPELRIGAVEQPLELEEGSLIVLVAESECFDFAKLVDHKMMSVMDEQAKDVVKSEVVFASVDVDDAISEIAKKDTSIIETKTMPISKSRLRMESVSTADFVLSSEHGTSIEYRSHIIISSALQQAIKPSDEILLDDGKILLRVENTDTTKTLARVLRGGVLRSHKSIKLVGKNVALPPLTAHDIENIRYAKAFGVTALMQPFVRGKEDLRYVRNCLKEHNAEHIKIFAKIENRIGVENIEDILQEADVIIIARGDLGNDMPLWELPRVQKQLEAASKAANKPYIVVTQMLASMEHSPVPTRAEVSDIFHAVYHGAWGVMVTGETAVGDYPVEVIRYLTNTAAEGLQSRS